MLPVSGPRSWVLFSYWASVLLAVGHVVYECDFWAYHAIFNDEAKFSEDPTCCNPKHDPACVEAKFKTKIFSRTKFAKFSTMFAWNRQYRIDSIVFSKKNNQRIFMDRRLLMNLVIDLKLILVFMEACITIETGTFSPC